LHLQRLYNNEKVGKCRLKTRKGRVYYALKINTYILSDSSGIQGLQKGRR